MCYGFIKWLILLFNRIRFENKINIEMRGCFVNLESLVEIRGNKIKWIKVI